MIETLRRKGFGRLLVDGRAVAFDDVDPAALAGRPMLQVVVDRVQLSGSDDDAPAADRLDRNGVSRRRRRGMGRRSRQLAGRRVRTRRVAESPSAEPGVHLFSERFECRPCGIAYEDPQPRLFSFNNPFGACPTCHGFGNIIELDMDLVVPDPSKSIAQNAIEPWSKPHYRAQLAELKRAARKRKLRLDVPWAELTDDEKHFVVEGGDDYDGIRGFFRWLERKKYKVHVRVFLSRYRGYLTCPDCGGARLRREARDVKVARPHDRSGRVADRPRGAAVLRRRSSCREKETAIAEKILKEIRRRLSFLSDVGLDYLTLDRLSSTLSGGEAQRINLATSLGSALVGTLYVLDEPSIGLHSRDNLRLIDILRQLRDQGNTVLVVEHDADMIKVADHIVDLGLGAGEQGGRVVFSGTLDGLMHEPRSLTSKYLRQELAIPVPTTRRRGTGQKIRLHRCHRAQPEGHRHHDSAEHADLRDRRQRIGQVDARARRALRGDQARQGRLGQAGRHLRQARGHRAHHRRRCWSTRRRSAGRRDRIRSPT